MKELSMVWSAILVFGALASLGVNVSAEEAEDILRSKRQVTYHEGSNSSVEDDGIAEEHYFTPATKKPLPTALVYPGDLTNFYKKDSPAEAKPDSSTRSGTNQVPESKSRKKRGGYIIEEQRRHRLPNIHKVTDKRLLSSEDRIRASYLHGGRAEFGESAAASNNIPAEMSFDGAGFLRTDFSEEVAIQSSRPHPRTRDYSSVNYKPRPQKDHAVNAFRAAFNPFVKRKPNPVQYDDEEEYSLQPQHVPGSTPGEKTAEEGTSTRDFFAGLNRQNFKNEEQSLPSLSSDTYDSHASNNPLIYNPKYFDPQSLRTPPYSSHDAEESLILNHRMPSHVAPDPIGSEEHSYNPFLQFQFQQFSETQRRRKRSTSVYRTVKGDPISPQEDSRLESAAHETLESYHAAPSVHDHSKSSTGFIPISFNGGTIHLSLPFYSGHSPPPPPPPRYPPPRSPVYTYQSYPPPVRPESRHFGSTGPSEHFFHPSEARRYSYGVLGSGNFEVIRGGIFPYESHRNRHHGGDNGFHDGRSAYGSNNFNSFGPTEIIIDGPIRGFQGFDNFPAHLINALTKHAEFSVHAPERRQDESQLIPVTYPLQAMA